jgi:phosphosulfolactate synthase
MNTLLDLPERTAKPRERGITHVLDSGLSIAAVDGLVEVTGGAVDLVKLGWGTALATGNLTAKLARYRAHGIPVVCGGTLTELAIAQDRVEALIAWLHDLGIEHVEVSDGTILIEHDRKLALIERLTHDFTVLSEVGAKDAEVVYAPEQWVSWIGEELAAGAWKVITEGREGGTSGMYRPSGEMRTGLVAEIVAHIDPAALIFEAPTKASQAWFVKQFGPGVNLGNIPVDEVIALETLRRGLRADTLLDLLSPAAAEEAAV